MRKKLIHNGKEVDGKNDLELIMIAHQCEGSIVGRLYDVVYEREDNNVNVDGGTAK